MSRLHHYGDIAEFAAAGIPAGEIAAMFRCTTSTVRRAVEEAERVKRMHEALTAKAQA